MEKVTLIIPAYNEERYIARVLQPVSQALKEKIIDEVIVVDDCSKDKTREVIDHFDFKTVCLCENHGKGGALKAGAAGATGEIILMIDADLVGLTTDHLKKILAPMAKDSSLGMVIGLIKHTDAISRRDRFRTTFSGQRAIRKSVLEKIADLDEAGYGTDYVITRYAKRNRIKVKKVNLVGVSQAIKEQKRGPIKGATRRLKMFGQIAKTFLRR